MNITTLPQAMERIADLEEQVTCLKEQLGLESRTDTITRLHLRWKLTVMEARFVEFLATRKGRPVSRASLMDALYGGRAEEPDQKIVDVYACKIRAKLGGTMIATVFGVGYRLTPEGLAAVEEALGAPLQEITPAPAPPRDGRHILQVPVLTALAQVGASDIASLHRRVVDKHPNVTEVQVRNALTAARAFERVEAVDWRIVPGGYRRVIYDLTDGGRDYVRQHLEDRLAAAGL